MNVLSAVVAKHRNKIAAARANKKRFEVWSRSTTGDDRRLGRGWREDSRTNADPGLFCTGSQHPLVSQCGFCSPSSMPPSVASLRPCFQGCLVKGHPVVLLLAVASTRRVLACHPVACPDPSRANCLNNCFHSPASACLMLSPMAASTLLAKIPQTNPWLQLLPFHEALIVTVCFHHGISSDTQICLIPFNASVVKTSATRLWFSIALGFWFCVCRQRQGPVHGFNHNPAAVAMTSLTSSLVVGSSLSLPAMSQLHCDRSLCSRVLRGHWCVLLYQSASDRHLSPPHTVVKGQRNGVNGSFALLVVCIVCFSACATTLYVFLLLLGPHG